MTKYLPLVLQYLFTRNSNRLCKPLSKKFVLKKQSFCLSNKLLKYGIRYQLLSTN